MNAIPSATAPSTPNRDRRPDARDTRRPAPPHLATGAPLCEVAGQAAGRLVVQQVAGWLGPASTSCDGTAAYRKKWLSSK